jgi:branched-chain amino acid transport system permease protein
LILGFPFLRVRGIYFAILTLLTAESLRLLAFNWKTLTGGAWGLVGIPPCGPISLPRFGEIQFETPGPYYYLMVALVSFSLWILYRLERSELGFTWRAIRETEKLAAAVGVNVLWFKILNFGIGCFFAGIAGALFAHFQRGLSADVNSTFGVLTSIYLFVYMVVGGQDHFAGPIVGAIALSLLNEFTRSLQAYQPMMIGAFAILIVLLLPKGLVGLPGQLLLWWKPRIEAETDACADTRPERH